MWLTDLLQIAHHVILVAFKDSAEEFYNLFVIEVINAFYDPWQQQFHCQVQISMELV